MKFSMVTISYNQGHYLEKAITSVLSQRQDGIDVEYIIVDAGSTDGSLRILERYRSAIDKAVIEPDDGPADGLNKGFSRASGEILGFLNADDYLLPGALCAVCEFFAQHTATDVVTGALVIQREPAEDNIVRLPGPRTARRILDGRTITLQQSTFFRRRAWEMTKGFNKENRTCWDGELFTDMLVAGATFGRTTAPLAVFRLHDASITGSAQLRDQYLRDQDRIRDKLISAGHSSTQEPLRSLLRLGWKVRPRTRLLERRLRRARNV